MATTQNNYTGNGSNKLFSVTFPYLDTADIDVFLNGTLQTVTTQYFFANATTVEFVTAPANGAAVRLDRSTDDSALAATFFPGSSIKAADLNADFDQTLYVVQEINNKAVNKTGDTMSGNLAMGGNRVTGLGTPISDADSATKLYIDQRYGELGVPGLTRWRNTATAGQTVFSGLGEYGGTLAYSANRESVFVNGAFQQRDIDYTADNGTSITITPALLVGDVVEVHCVNNVSGAVTDQSSGIYFTQAGTGATARTIDSKLKDMVSVKDFGAIGDGVANDAPAFQAAIDSGAKYIRVPAPATQYLLTQSLNMTGLRGVTFEFEASLDISGAPGFCQILAKHNGAVFDLTGSFDCCFINASVEGDAVSVPTCMFLLARNTSASSASRHRFFNPRSTGHFSTAVVYNYGSEENDFFGPFFVQKAAGKSCVYLAATNAASLSSQFATISTGTQSTTVLRFFGGCFYSQGNSGSENETCFVLNGVSDVTISDPFMYCPYGKSLIFVNTATSASDLVHVKGVRSEITGTLPQHGVYFSTGAAVSCSFWSIRDSRFPVDSNVVYAEDSVTLASLQYVNISASTGNAISARNLQDCFINHASSVITGRAGGTVQRNTFIGYEANRTLSGTNTTNTFTNTNEGSFQANGFKFPASQVSSANVNTLDDYEEGVFTPVLTCATPGNLTRTYATQEGFYTKIGRLVTVHIAIGTATFTHTTASGIVFITGLPFTPVQNNYAAFSSWAGFTSANYTFLSAQIVGTVSSVYVNKSGSGQALALTPITDFPTGGTVQLYSNFSYLAAT
jgi:hypothetical protein